MWVGLVVLQLQLQHYDLVPSLALPRLQLLQLWRRGSPGNPERARGYVCVRHASHAHDLHTLCMRARKGAVARIEPATHDLREYTTGF